MHCTAEPAISTASCLCVDASSAAWLYVLLPQLYCRCAGLYRYLLDFSPDHPHYDLRQVFCAGTCPCCLKICVRYTTLCLPGCSHLHSCRALQLLLWDCLLCGCLV